MNNQSSKPEGYFLLMQPDQQAAVRVDFSAMRQSLKRGWPIILCTTVAFVVLAVIHAFFLATLMYKSTALLAIRSQQNGGAGANQQLAGIASLAGIQLGGGGSKRDEYMAILSSRTVVRKLIEKDHLLPVLFAKKYDSENKAWKGTPPTMGTALDYFTKAVREITEDKKTGLVSLTVTWRDPAIAAQWATQMVMIANQTVRDTTIKQAAQNIQYLNKEMQGATFETVRESIVHLTEANMNQAMLAQVQNDYAYAIIDAPEVSEKNKFVKPQRAIEISVAILLGLMISASYILLRNRNLIIHRPKETP